MQIKCGVFSFMLPKIDGNKCVGCGACVKQCPMNVLELGDDHKSGVARPKDCVECRACEAACPVKAISFN